jgi:hypothetical protein
MTGLVDLLRAKAASVRNSAERGLAYYMGPAYQPAARMGQLVSMMSPGADMMDMAASSSDLMRSRGGWEAAQAAAGLGAATLGMAIPGTAKGISEGVTDGIRAYHGSPHDFDAFSMDKIGTGEGNAMFGRGLNFTTDQAEAERYRNLLSLRRDGPKGKAFEVSIKAKPEQFLNWNDLSSEQQAALRTKPGVRKAQREGASGVRVDAPAGSNNDTSHYVVFDDKLIEIMRKYGLAGLMMGGGGLAYGAGGEQPDG